MVGVTVFESVHNELNPAIFSGSNAGQNGSAIRFSDNFADGPDT